MSNGWTASRYQIARMILGTYLIVHFAQLAPWAAELFSSEGALPNRSASPLLLFPNALALSDGPLFVTVFVAAGATLSIFLALGYWDRLASVVLWYIWACLHGRMPLIINPGLPYVGWLLLMHACLPPARGGLPTLRRHNEKVWHMPREIFLAAWALMAIGYTYSGAAKLTSPSWLNGSALAYVLDNPLARPGPARDVLLSLPGGVLSLMTWTALILELLFAPLALIRPVRPWLWLSMVVMHVGLIGVLDFADLSLGMLMLHVFTFDPGWLIPIESSRMVPGLKTRPTYQLSIL